MALKLLAAGQDESLLKSFRREFEVLAALTHPSLSEVYDFGETSEGAAEGLPRGTFFTREFVPGESLRVVGGAAGDLRRIARICVELCDALAPLHRSGLLHGDLKPDNVIVSVGSVGSVGSAGSVVSMGALADSDVARLRLIDFGFVRRQGDPSAEPSGTLAYMAPEVLDRRPLDPRTDLYALGAMLWEMLSGKPPFWEGGFGAIVDGHLNRVPGPLVPRQRAWQESASSSSSPWAAIEGIARRLLEKDPAQRFPDAAEVAAALRGAVPGLPAGSPLPVVPARAGMLSRDGELAQIEATLRGRLAERDAASPQLVLVHGEAGAGKSTLLREVKWRAQLSGVRVLELRGERQTGAREALVALVEGALAILGSDDLNQAVAHRILGSLEVGDAGEAAGAGELSVQFENVARVVLAASRRTPLLVLCDDLDRCESDAIALLRYVAYSANPEDPLLVVASSSDVAIQGPLGPQRTIDLPPLGAAQTRDLVAAFLGRPDDGLADAISAHAGGNPLFTVELLREFGGEGGVDADVVRLPKRLEDVWCRRIDALAEPERRVVHALAVLGTPCPAAAVRHLAEVVDAARAIDALRDRGMVRVTEAAAVELRPPALGQAALASLDDDRRRALHARIARVFADGPLPPLLLARHRVLGGDREWARTNGLAQAEAARRAGAHRLAIEIDQGLLALLADEPVGVEAALALAQARYAVGQYEAALADARAARDRAGGGYRCRALSIEGRVLSALGRLDEATGALEESQRLASSSAERAPILRDLARAHMRRGDYETAEAAARMALGPLSAEDPVRTELLTTLGMIAGYRGDSRGALEQLEAALAVARKTGLRRDEGNVLEYIALAHGRAGELASAIDFHRQSIAIARDLGDSGSLATCHLNLGGALYSAGDPARALEHYEAAFRLSRRIGRTTTALFAQCNLANLYAYLGLFERARHEAETVRADAQRLGVKPAAAQAVAILGDVAGRRGSFDEAIGHFEDALSRMQELGQAREAAEVGMERVEVLLALARPADLVAAEQGWQAVSAVVSEQRIGDFEPRLQLLRARLLLARGDADEALRLLDAAAHRAHALRQRDIEWQAHFWAAGLNTSRGAEFSGRRRLQMALEILEEIASALPREFQNSFWQDRSRAGARAQLMASGEPTAPAGSAAGSIGSTGSVAARSSSPAGSPPPDGLRPLGTPEAVSAERLDRILAIYRKLTTEHDLERLLELIMDTAVELTGAERGFLLLADATGSLGVVTARDFEHATPSDPHAQFSRTIAESVFIDGEPVITTSAQDDARFNEFMSVHQLRLESVLCIPIRARDKVIGVLYMENRVRRGRFGEQDERLLVSFGDQVAIAIENARLLRENVDRQEQLAAANQQLSDAKREIEEVLARRTAQLEEARRDLRRVQGQTDDQFGYRGIVGHAESMRRVFAVIERVQDAAIPVVIQGESGTGKELVARAIHFGGTRAKAAFVAVNCAAIPEGLLESELFGHLRGSFTGADRDKRGLIAAANGGTLFLDEVGEMPLRMQVDLLRALQEGKVRPVGSEQDTEVDVRVIAASNRPLEPMVQEGAFREDLYYRLSVVTISLPPLRDRAEDIPLLVDHFLQRLVARTKSDKKVVSRDAMRRLMDYPWPGNIRQLEHVLLNASILADKRVLDPGDFALPSTGERGAPGRTVAQGRRDAEREKILEALEKSNWNKTKTCEILGMPRRTLYRRLREYGIQ